MKSLLSHFSNKLSPSPFSHWQLGNPFILNLKGMKYILRAHEDVINSVVMDYIDRKTGSQAEARCLKIIGSVVKSIKVNLLSDSQEMVSKQLRD